MTNTLYYGDSLRILRDHIPDESVDLVYLDPPFNSNRTYNVLFKERSGEASPAQIEAFNDTWTWDRSAEKQYDELVIDGPPNVSRMIGALRQFIGSNDMMAYLVMMAAQRCMACAKCVPVGAGIRGQCYGLRHARVVRCCRSRNLCAALGCA